MSQYDDDMGVVRSRSRGPSLLIAVVMAVVGSWLGVFLASRTART